MKVKQIRLEVDPYKPYRLSQAIQVQNLLFVSGQAAYNAAGDLIGVGDFTAQAQQAFENLSKVLRAGSSDLSQVVKVTIFLKDMASNFHHIVELRGQYFQQPYPADTIVEISSLYHPDALIEIEAIAVVNGNWGDRAAES